MTPTKRSNGQCTCPTWMQQEYMHNPDCPALYPLQPQPGDEPDTLTRLTRLVRHRLGVGSDDFLDSVLDLISEAAEERKALDADIQRHMTTIARRDRTISTQQETITALSNKATEALRMGQQQGRVELATELLGLTSSEALRVLEGIVNEDT